jgi:glycosyltransferase involved in cell wall biosynthesis
MRKKVFFEPLWDIRGAARRVIDLPPNGYEFVVAQRPEDKLFYNLAVRWPFTHRLLSQLTNRIVPDVLLRCWLQRWRKPPEETALTYGFEHIVLRPEPWIVEVETASLLVGSRPQHFRMFKFVLARALASPHCRKIICWSEAGRRTITEGLNSEGFQQKVEIVYYAAPAKHFVKDYEAKKSIKILFVGSQAIDRPFEMYGGVEILEAFALLHSRYDVEMLVRATVPADVKAKYSRMEGLRIIDQVVPWELLEQEFQSADIGVLPYHSTAPHTILDMMSYELPVVGRNCWANPEYILDGVTGLLVQPSRKVPYYYGNTCHPNSATRGFRRAIREPDADVVNELVQKLSLLIETPELRKRLGQAARCEVEHGKFSSKVRSDKLKRIFDEAIAGDKKT